ncbi:MAG: PAS domain S-box protein [Tahibacter sp.]
MLHCTGAAAVKDRLHLVIIAKPELASRLESLAIASGAVSLSSSLNDLDTAARSLRCVNCDVLLVHAEGLSVARVSELKLAAPDASLIVIDDETDQTRDPRWIEAGADASLGLRGLDASILSRQIQQALARHIASAALASRITDLQSLFDHGPTPAWVCDGDTLQVLAVNDEAVKTYAFSRSSFLQMALDDLSPVEDRPALREVILDTLPLREAKNVWRHITADGRSLSVELTVQALNYAQRDALLVVGRDITTQRIAINAVEASERRFRDLFEHSHGLICTHDPAGVMLSANPAAAGALGYRVADVVGRSMKDLIAPSLHRYFDEYLQRIARTGEDSGLLYLTHRDGSPRVWEYHNRIHRSEAEQTYVVGHAQDITQRREYERQLRQQQAELEAVNDASPLGLFRATLDGGYCYVNRAFERLSGLRTDEAMGDGWERALHPEDREHVVDMWNSAIRERGRFQSIHRFRQDSGATVWVSVIASPFIVEGDVTGYMGSVEDITARHHAEQQLRRNEQRLRTIADATPAIIGYVDAAQRFVFANAAYERQYGRGNQVIGRHAREVVGETIYARRLPFIERALRGERVSFEDEEVVGGDYRCMEVTYIPQRDEDDREVLGMHVMVQDITRMKLEERRWMQAAEVDSLTGLANRAAFIERLNRALARSRDQQSMLALMYLDIDRFKQVNDTYGHGRGDALLRSFAERLSAVLRKSDVIGRLGGDEFTVISEGVRRPEYATVVAAKVVSAMRRPFVFADAPPTLQITTSIGLALTVNEPTMTAEALLERADQALYEAKAAGRDGYRVAAECYRIARA